MTLVSLTVVRLPSLALRPLKAPVRVVKGDIAADVVSILRDTVGGGGPRAAHAAASLIKCQRLL